MNKEETFKQFYPMIQKVSWLYSKKYFLEKDDIQSEAYIIFCNALNNYDKKKATFSTYLYNELKRLDFYCKKNYKNNCPAIIRIKENHKSGYGKNIFINKIENIDINYMDFNIFEKVIENLDYKYSLSNDSKIIINYILSKEWENIERKRKWVPRYSHILNKYKSIGWTNKRIKEAWEEIKEWWISSNHDYFCLEV